MSKTARNNIQLLTFGNDFNDYTKNEEHMNNVFRGEQSQEAIILAGGTNCWLAYLDVEDKMVPREKEYSLNLINCTFNGSDCV